jgi:hypothetical protein
VTPPAEGSSDEAILDSLELELRKLPGVASVGFSGRDRHLTVHLALAPGVDNASVRNEGQELARAHFDHPVAVTVEVLGQSAEPSDPSDEAGVGEERVTRSASNDWATSAAAVVLADVESAGPPDLQQLERMEPAPVQTEPPPTPADPRAVGPPTRGATDDADFGTGEDHPPPSVVTGRRGSDRVKQPGRQARTRPRVALLGVHVVDGGREVEVHLGHEARRTVGRGRAGRTSSTVLATLEALQDLGWALPFTLRTTVRLGLGVDGAVAVVLGGPGGDRLGLGRAATPDHATVKATLQALNRFLEDPRSLGSAAS